MEWIVRGATTKQQALRKARAAVNVLLAGDYLQLCLACPSPILAAGVGLFGRGLLLDQSLNNSRDVLSHLGLSRTTDCAMSGSSSLSIQPRTRASSTGTGRPSISALPSASRRPNWLALVSPSVQAGRHAARVESGNRRMAGDRGLDCRRARARGVLRVLGVGDPAWVARHFRFALIEYAKPYTRSKGDHRWYALPPPTLSPELLALHHKILTLRKGVLAHSDLTLKKAQLHVHTFGGKPSYSISSSFAEALPSREAVITLIERTLDQMYVESDQRLPESSGDQRNF